jgi:2-dehydro-3-deoxygalactonokinase
VNGLVAVDWGTSSLRAASLDERGRVVEEHSIPRGILTVAPGEFANVLEAATARWPRRSGTLCLLSGMVGSRQGWMEAPYCACPAGFADIAARLAWVEPGRVAIVPGLRCEVQGVPDVMRGEETQVFGALSLLGLQAARLVLPGTHSKWVRARAGRIESFATFITGEIYALLRRHSILARTLPDADGELDPGAFEQGFRHALRIGNLLRAAFSARTLSLFDRLPAKLGPSYLSGLVIGEELRSQHLSTADDPVIVVGSPALTQRYELALRLLGVRTMAVGSEATWHGSWSLARKLEETA